MLCKRGLEARKILLYDPRSFSCRGRHRHRHLATLGGEVYLRAVEHGRLKNYAYLALPLCKRRRNGDLGNNGLDDLIDYLDRFANGLCNHLGARRLCGGDL